MEQYNRNDLIPRVEGESVGVIGVGKMGSGIAWSLLRNGANVTLFSRSMNQQVDQLVKAGAKMTESPAEVAGYCSAIVLALPTTEDVVNVCMGPGGLVSSSVSGSLVIDTTTGDPDGTKVLSNDLRNRHISYVDAPVTRGPQEARDGKLNVMFGCDPGQRDRALKILAAFSEYAIYTGPVSSAQRLKLINNLLSMSVVAISAECIAIAHRMGVNVEQLQALTSRGGVSSGILQTLLAIDLGDSEKNLDFAIGHALKDLRYALGQKEIHNGHWVVSRAVADTFGLAVEEGFAAKTLPALLKLVDYR